jgi:hypothetical protein
MHFEGKTPEETVGITRAERQRVHTRDLYGRLSSSAFEGFESIVNAQGGDNIMHITFSPEGVDVTISTRQQE